MRMYRHGEVVGMCDRSNESAMVTGSNPSPALCCAGQTFARRAESELGAPRQHKTVSNEVIQGKAQ